MLVKPKFIWHFTQVLWGKPFLQSFLTFCLPSQLAEGNFPFFDRNIFATYKLYTDLQTLTCLMKSPLFSQLRKYVAIDVIDISPLLATKNPGKYEILSICHNHSYAVAKQEGAAITFLAPDILFSTGLFSYLYQLFKQKKPLIVSAGVRLSKETMTQELTRRKLLSKNPLALTAKQLTSLAYKALHPLTQSLIWNQGRLTTHPFHLYWDSGEKTLLIRPFFLHPLGLLTQMTSPYQEPIKGNIDGEFLCQAVPDLTKWELITTTTKVCSFELSDNDAMTFTSFNPPSPLLAQLWMKKNIAPNQRLFAKWKFYLGERKSLPSFEAIEKESDEVIASILQKNYPLPENLAGLMRLRWYQLRHLLAKRVFWAHLLARKKSAMNWPTLQVTRQFPQRH